MQNRTPPRSGVADDPDFRDWLDTIFRNRWLILGVAGATIVLAALYTWMQDPVYQSSATIRIDEEGTGMNLLRELGPAAGGGRGIIETEMVVLQSRQIAEAAVDSLALNVRLVEPSRLPRSEVVRVLQGSRNVAEGLYRLERTSGGSYTVVAEEVVDPPGLPKRVDIGQPVQIGGVTIALSPSLRDAPPERIEIQLMSFPAAVRELRSAMSVLRPDPDAQVVSVEFRNTDPWLAAAVPNAVTDLFIEYKNRANKVESSSTVRFLRGQVSTYEGQLRNAETTLRSFREEQQVVSPQEEASEQVKRLAELRAQRDALQGERDALAQLLSRVSAESAAGATEQSPYRQLASFPIFLANRAVQDILQSITQLENERAELLVRRTAENFDVQGINRRIEELELQLYRIARNYLSSIESQLASLNSNLARFGNRLEEIPAREVQFARLVREQRLIEELYTLLQTRLKEAEIQEAVQPGDVRVIDPALVPESPISPSPLRNLALAAVLGTILGVGVAVVRQALDRKVRTHEDLDILTGGAPVLGTIPRIRAKAVTNGDDRKKPRIISLAPSTLFGERLITRRDPSNPVAEAYRALRTSITYASVDRAPKVMVITSAMPGDGKSTSASNLAITLAQQGMRTVLVDADLRRGLLHRVFDTPQEPGLTNVLTGRSRLSDAIQEVESGHSGTPLFFLASGVFPPNPAEMLGSDRMRELLDTLREQYDAVVLDAPPLNLVTDAAVLGTLADTTVIVTRAGVTEKGALQFAIAQLRNVRAPMGGVVLNDFDASPASYYGGYGYYGYGVEKHYANGSGNGKR